MTTVQQFSTQVIQSNPDYHFIYSTGSGLSHVVSGCAQCLVGVGMKCSRDPYYYEQQSQAHIQRGWRDLQKGVRDILPAAVVTGTVIVGYFLVKNN